ncbi:hypothetical protein C5U48_12835 [Mycolicibacter virginiensis]|uniref:Uncharacterized protein n=1 Tax=Mycolicibacter virginiensis TaxID=1795032 RepID=A0A9X7NY98_9MYCO|nr:hypothetical protein [Mycolicibacter virginiensis]PQM51806.1 hypothetical protein C5U48_12835 [Mycolicibacter virginiensis]
MPDFTSVFTQERNHWQQRAETAEAELARLHELIRRGLPHGEHFNSPFAAAARVELRDAAGMQRGGQ